MANDIHLVAGSELLSRCPEYCVLKNLRLCLVSAGKPWLMVWSSGVMELLTCIQMPLSAVAVALWRSPPQSSSCWSIYCLLYYMYSATLITRVATINGISHLCAWEEQLLWKTKFKPPWLSNDRTRRYWMSRSYLRNDKTMSFELRVLSLEQPRLL